MSDELTARVRAALEHILATLEQTGPQAPDAPSLLLLTMQAVQSLGDDVQALTAAVAGISDNVARLAIQAKGFETERAELLRRLEVVERGKGDGNLPGDTGSGPHRNRSAD